jgi:hypothetical protein
VLHQTEYYGDNDKHDAKNLTDSFGIQVLSRLLLLAL